MTKLEQKNIEIFSSGATGSIEQFGTIKNGSPVYSDDPDVIMGFTGATGHTGLTGVNAWSEGLYAGITGDNILSIQTLNSIFYVLTRWLNTWNQYGVPRWVNDVTYFDKAIVTDTEGNIFQSLGSSNLNKGLTDSSYWSPYLTNKVNFITDNYTISNDDHLIIWNIATVTGATGPNTITFPLITNHYNREIIICVAGDTTETDVIIKSSGGITIDTIPQYQWMKYYYTVDGWYSTQLT